MSLFACFGSRKRETRSGSLVDYWDCSGLGLSDLPKEVIQHRRTLRQLTLSCNNIKDVPKVRERESEGREKGREGGGLY